MGQAETRALLGALDGDRALAEGRQHDFQLVLGDARPIVLDRDVLAAAGRPADADAHFAAARRELDGVGQEVERDLAQRPFVGQHARQGGLELGNEANVLVARLELHQVAALLGDVLEIDRLFLQLVAPGLDAGQVEDLVDEVQQMLARRVDVAGIVAIRSRCPSSPAPRSSSLRRSREWR